MYQSGFFVMTILMPVASTILFTLLERFTGFGKMKSLYRKILIGIVFSVTAVLATEWGLESTFSVINVRDASPVCAAFTFGAVPGIIAAIIGSAYRLLSAWLWNIGTFSAVACSLSTLFIGIAAAVTQHFLRKHYYFSLLSVTAFCVIAEGTHMLLIFLTHPNDIPSAYNVVSECVLPMICFTAITVTVSRLMAILIRKENDKFFVSRSEKSISVVIERILIISMFVVYLFTSVLTYLIQTNAAFSRSEDMLLTQLETLEWQTEKASEEMIYNLMIKMCYFSNEYETPLYNIYKDSFKDINHDDVIDDKDVTALLSNYCKEYSATQIDLIDENRTVLYSSNSEQTGKKIADAAFFENIDEKGYYVETEVRQDKSFLCSGMSFISGENKFFRQSIYIRCLFEEEMLPYFIRYYIYTTAESFHFGNAGTMLVLSATHDEDGNYEVIKPMVDIGEDTIPDTVNFLIPEQMQPYTLTEVNYTDKPHNMVYAQANGLYYVTLLDKEISMQERDISVLITLLMEMDILALVMIILYGSIRLHVIKNIDKVNNGLDEICQGNLDVTIDVRSNREFSMLSDDINSTVHTLKQYIEAEASRIDEELALAHSIQTSSLPCIFPPYPNHQEFAIYAHMSPAREVGGDFYDFYFIDKNTLAFLIADVSGKGIPAALFMMTARTTLKDIALQGKPIEEVFDIANRQLYETNPSKMFVTVWMGLLDVNTGTLQYVNAGHNPPLLFHNGSYEYLKGRTGFVLAGLKQTHYQSRTIQLAYGDGLLLYTDGVTEAKNKDEQFYGETRLQALCNGIGTADVQNICDTVRNDVNCVAADCEQADDMTVLSVCYHGSAAPFTVKRNFTDTPDKTKEVIGFVTETLTSQQCSDIMINRFQICTDEVFSNIVKYAYPEKTGEVIVELELYAEKTVMRFTDYGIPFDPVSFVNAELILSPKKRKPGGLGIFLVKKLMDNVEYFYQNAENHLILTLDKI